MGWKTSPVNMITVMLVTADAWIWNRKYHHSSGIGFTRRLFNSSEGLSGRGQRKTKCKTNNKLLLNLTSLTPKIGSCPSSPFLAGPAGASPRLLKFLLPSSGKFIPPAFSEPSPGLLARIRATFGDLIITSATAVFCATFLILAIILKYLALL